MIIRGQIVFDFKPQRFKYLERKENKKIKRADINELTERLKVNKRSDFYSNTMVVAFCLCCVTIIALISFKF